MDKLKPCPFCPDWLRSVPNYEGIYWVTRSGEIINQRGMVLKPYDNGYGYLVVDLRKGRRKNTFVSIELLPKHLFQIP